MHAFLSPCCFCNGRDTSIYDYDCVSVQLRRAELIHQCVIRYGTTQKTVIVMHGESSDMLRRQWNQMQERSEEQS